MMRFRRRFLWIPGLLLLIWHCGSGMKPVRPVRVMTFNIRLNTSSDSLNAWPYRKDMAADMIRFHHAEIIGIQEALADQVRDLADRLSDYGWFGVGRDDGLDQGEFMAVFFLKNRFKVLQSATFWLSGNPDKPGRGWDAACNRVVTWGNFQDLETGKTFYLFNTHFDHRGETARIESAKLLLSSIHEIAGSADVIVTGDFNATPDMAPVQILTRSAETDPGPMLADAKAVSIHPHHGPAGTFNGFQQAYTAGNDQPIDYIFVTPGITVLNHGTLSDHFDGRMPSDHYPVLAEVVQNQR